MRASRTLQSSMSPESSLGQSADWLLTSDSKLFHERKFLRTFNNLPRDWSIVNPFSSWKKRREPSCMIYIFCLYVKAASPCIESVESAWRCNSCSWVLFHRCWRSSELSAPEGSSRCWWRGQPPPRLTQDNWRSASVITRVTHRCLRAASWRPGSWSAWPWCGPRTGAGSTAGASSYRRWRGNNPSRFFDLLTGLEEKTSQWECPPVCSSLLTENHVGESSLLDKLLVLFCSV